jgi:two-component system sensor histidine kinase DesK
MAKHPSRRPTERDVEESDLSVAQASPIEDETTPPAWERGHGLAYLALVTLAGPASDVVGGQARPTWLAALALAAFVVCYAVGLETGRHWRGGCCEVSQRRRQVHYLAVAALGPVAIATALGFGANWFVLFIFVAVTAVLNLPLAWGARADAAVGVVVMVVELARGLTLSNLASGLSWALAAVVIGYVALLLRKRAELIGELREAQGEVARLAAADAVAEERLRFARDLHDLLGHSLSVIVLKTELAGRLFDSGAGPQARAEVGDAEEIARRSLAEVREAVSGYRRQSLGTEFEQARAALEAAGVQVSVVKMVSGLPADIDDLLGWVVREAATNVVRHSNARHAEIDLTMVDRAVRLEVADDGVGIPEADAAASDGSGLLGLRERVADMGGSFEAGGRSGGGFALRVTVPLGASAETANVALAADAKEAQS